MHSKLTLSSIRHFGYLSAGHTIYGNSSLTQQERKVSAFAGMTTNSPKGRGIKPEEIQSRAIPLFRSTSDCRYQYTLNFCYHVMLE